MINRLTVYGFGNRGKDVVDQLIAQGLEVAMIFDDSPSQSSYRNIKVCSLHEASAQACAKGSQCVIALHNSYVDILEINQKLLSLNAVPVSLINADIFGLNIKVTNGYWLDKSSPAFKISSSDTEWMLEHLADEASRMVFMGLKSYRDTGDIGACPKPSLADEYTPNDLPTYPESINLIDCGAYTGVAYRKFAYRYKIKKYLAFEPDPANYRELCAQEFDCDDLTLLPLGVWDKTEQLRFSVGRNMGSTIDGEGESMIQSVAVDDLARFFEPDVVKFDIEGAEWRGLLGMKSIISRRRPSLCISVYHRPEDLVAIPKNLTSWGLRDKLFLRIHEHNGFGTVLYARPEM